MRADATSNGSPDEAPVKSEASMWRLRAEEIGPSALVVLVPFLWKFAFPHLPDAWRMSAYGLTEVAGIAASILSIVIRLDTHSEPA